MLVCDFPAPDNRRTSMDIQIAFHETGDADVLSVSPAETAAPGPDEVRLRQHAVGVNFVDIYHRTGLYPVPKLPAVPGVEGAGVVEAIGDNVTTLKPGDRVAYAGLPLGAYATTRLLPASRAIPLPDSVSLERAASSMLRGLTVHMLLNRVIPERCQETLLVYAAAGGLGQYLTRWASHRGSRVIGIAGSTAKAKIAVEAGARDVIVGRQADIVKEVNALTGNDGVDAIVDGVGGDNFLQNFQAIKPFGSVLSVGQAGGPLPPIPAEALSARSASFARPSVIAYISDVETYTRAARDVIDMMTKGVHATIGKTYPLGEAAQAHKEMEGGETTGSLLLLP